jgi:hypothetical protein
MKLYAIVMMIALLVGVPIAAQAAEENEKAFVYGDYEFFSGTDVYVIYHHGYVMIVPGSSPASSREVIYIFTHMFDTMDEFIPTFYMLVENVAGQMDMQQGYVHINEEDWLVVWTPESGYMYTKFQ